MERILEEQGLKIEMKRIIIQENTFEKARNEIRKNKDKEIIFSSKNDDLSRKIMEKEKIDFLLINLANRRDFQKQRNSGFNHVLAKIAKNKGIKIGINFDEVLESKGKERAEILSRIEQNIVLCNKNKIKVKFISSKPENIRDNYDLKALGIVLGMPSWMTKEL